MPAPSDARRLVKSGVSTALAVSVAALGAVVAVPVAQAATGPVAYDCTTPTGPHSLTVDIDTSAPVAPGVLFAGDPVGVTASTALPTGLARWARDVHGADSLSGTVTSTITEGTVSRTLSLVVPTTSLGGQTDAAPVPFTASGAFVATTPGVQVLQARGLEVVLDLSRADGTSQRLTMSCTEAAGVAPTIDTVTVVARSATSLAVDQPVARYGEAVTAAAQVSTSGGAPRGDVAFSLDGVATKAGVAEGGSSSWRLPTAPAGTHVLSASFVPEDATFYRGSTSAATTLTIRKATTRSRVSITGKRTGRPTKVVVRVRAAHGTTSTGRVRLVLRRTGRAAGKQRWVRKRRLTAGQRTVGFGRLAPGRFKVVVRYSGDANHMRGPASVRKFRVTRPSR